MGTARHHTDGCQYWACHYDDARSVLQRTEPFLHSLPLHHNYVLTLLQARSRLHEPGSYWVVSDKEEPCGLAVQSPPNRPVNLTPMEPAPLHALADYMAKTGVSISGVVGVPRTSTCFAAAWTEQRGCGARPVGASRAYEQENTPATKRAAGELDLAIARDTVAVTDLTRDFFAEIGESALDLPALVKQRIASGCLYVWRDSGRIRSFTGHFAPANGVVRLHSIYTPEEHRGRGYGLSAFAALSQILADRGFRRLALTNLSNAVSNRMLRRAGYRAKFELLRYEF